MRVLLSGAGGGIGGAIQRQLDADGHTVWQPFMHADAVICCAGTNDPEQAVAVNLEWTMQLFDVHPEATYYIAFSGGGVGGVPTTEMSAEYVATKAALAVFAEQFALLHPTKHVFAVSPGLTDTKLNTSTTRGAKPEVPAAFVCKLLSGKYHHLSGSLLAAQRDDLDTMTPMRLRRVPV